MSNPSKYYTALTIEEWVDDDESGASWKSIGGYKGFIQPIGGGESFQKGKNGESATHRMYTFVSTPSQQGWRVTQGGQSYVMLWAIQPDGISSVGSHKEIILGLFE